MLQVVLTISEQLTDDKSILAFETDYKNKYLLFHIIISSLLLTLVHYGDVLYLLSMIFILITSSCTDRTKFPESLSCYLSLSSITPSRFSWQHPVSAQIYVSTCWLANTGTSMYMSPLENITYEFVLTFLAYLFCLTWMPCEVRVKWPYKCYFVVYCFQDLFKTLCTILV